MSSNSDVLERLHRIEKKHGGVLRPDDVVKDAENPRSPLHGYFEWDDAIAGARYRLDQARELIRSVRVEIRNDEHVVRVIGYVQDPSKGSREQGYVSTASLKTDRGRAVDALVNELTRAEHAMMRAYQVADALDLQGSVTEILARIRGVRAAV